MATKTTTEFTCDICTEKVTVESGKPKDWIELNFENKFVDRSFYEKHICPDCVQRIIKARAQAAIKH